MPSMFRITSNAREYMADLARTVGALQAVTPDTLTDTAEAVTVRSERNIRREMIVRTTYTTKSLRTYKASASKPLARQNAVSGTVSDYLPIQDEGGTVRAKKQRIAVPTNTVRGVNRRKRIPTRYKIDEMGERAFTLGPSKAGKPRKRRGKIIPYVLSRPALFLRTGRRTLKKVRDLGARDYKLRATRWHSEAVERYGNWTYMAQAFARNARRRLGSVAK